MSEKIKRVRFNGIMPQSLFDELKKIAEIENRSLSNLFNRIFEEYCINYKNKNED